MKYNWTKKEKDLVEKYVKKYKNVLYIDGWTVTIHFENGQPMAGDRIRGRDFIPYATNTITEAYEKIEITFHAALLADIRSSQKLELEQTVKHELCHCLTQELFEASLNRHITEKECVDAVERLTERISKLI